MSRAFEYRVPSIGVEEEYQLVDPSSGGLAPQGRAVVKSANSATTSDIQHELHLEQIEMASPVLRDSQQVMDCLANTRHTLIQAAEANDVAIVAAGTNPCRLPQHVFITPKPRYEMMAEQYQALARELVIFGCHVHVDMPDRDLGVRIMNYARPWLPLLQAMSANSPFWNSEDTGYESYRRELWVRWPTSGIPHWFKDFDDYDACVKQLVRAGAIDDESKIYWDIRLPTKVDTIEFRIFDIQTELADCAALVAITRALVMRCERAVLCNEPLPRIRSVLLKSAVWQAARYGLNLRLMDPLHGNQISAMAHVQDLMNYIAEPIELLGDQKLINDYIARLRHQGTPSMRQRKTLADSSGDYAALVRRLIECTAGRPQRFSTLAS